MCFQTHVCRYLCPQTRTLSMKKMPTALFSSCFSICWSYVVHPGFVSRRSVFWMCPGWKLVLVAPGHQKRTSQGTRKTWTLHCERGSVRPSSFVISSAQPKAAGILQSSLRHGPQRTIRQCAEDCPWSQEGAPPESSGKEALLMWFFNARLLWTARFVISGFEILLMENPH